jgi:hypothetical protein
VFKRYLQIRTKLVLLTIFFSNPKVSWKELLSSHYKQTVNRINESTSNYIYVIQDSTFYNYTKHKGKTDIGNIGQQWNQTQFGLIQHTAFCITESDGPLGIIAVDFFGYGENFDDTDCPIDYQPLEENLASERWCIFLLKAQNRLKECGKKIITICDREADSFEFLYNCTKYSALFVVRCKWNRHTGMKARRKEEKLFSLLEKAPYLGHFKTTIYDIDKHRDIEVNFQLKALKGVSIPPPHRGAGHKQNSIDPIKINVVQATEGDRSWVLITNLPVDTLEDIKFIIKSYKYRWHIESFHKVLKTAYKAEHVYLHSSRAAIQTLLALINIAACRTYWLICKAREIDDKPATLCFNITELKAVHIYFHPSIPFPEKIPTLKTIFYQIAKLGGYKNIKNSYPPGILTIYRGITKLNTITRMFISLTLSRKT